MLGVIGDFFSGIFSSGWEKIKSWFPSFKDMFGFYMLIPIGIKYIVNFFLSSMGDDDGPGFAVRVGGEYIIAAAMAIASLTRTGISCPDGIAFKKMISLLSIYCMVNFIIPVVIGILGFIPVIGIPISMLGMLGESFEWAGGYVVWELIMNIIAYYKDGSYQAQFNKECETSKLPWSEFTWIIYIAMLLIGPGFTVYAQDSGMFEI
jgi:hypothetical protein